MTDTQKYAYDDSNLLDSMLIYQMVINFWFF